MIVIYFWKISPQQIPFAIAAMAFNRFKLTRDKNVSFYKSIGTGKGETFRPNDADPLRWGLIAAVDELNTFDESPIVAIWRKKSIAEFRAVLSPISSHGKWAGKEPFIVQSQQWDGPIAAITRARIKWHHNFRFWRSVPPVTISLKSAPGLTHAIGIGEAPIGLQGTFSMWESAAAVRDFAYRGQAHQKAIADTAKYDWYAEELFARFAVIEQRGSIK